jgi:hypothetical protein
MAALETEKEEFTGSRRALLALLTAGAVAAAKSASAQSDKTGDLSDAALKRRLLRRMTYGPLPEDVTKINALGYDGWLDYQLNYETIDDSACENAVAWYSTVFFSERDLFKVIPSVAEHEITVATMIRAVMSKRQLYQRMCEFWTDHFNILFEKVGVLKVVHDRDVIRKHALGNFKDMLMANTKSPATLVYLDNDPSSKENPNQNLAREMMELHSVGVHGGYTQTDVKQVARCITGWTAVLWPQDAPDIGKFKFDKYLHAGGTKVVYGVTIPAGGGIAEGEKVVRILGNRRACAEFIATKLFRFFLGYEPTEAQVDQVANIYVETDGEIKPMVKAVLSQANIQLTSLMLKRPFHFSMGLLRQTQASVSSYYPLRDWLYALGQHPFNWAAPNGYPAAATYWRGGLLSRWNFGIHLFANEIDSVKLAKKDYLRSAVLLEDVLHRINDMLFQGELSTGDKNLLRSVLVSDDLALGKATKAFGLATTLPGYQKC